MENPWIFQFDCPRSQLGLYITVRCYWRGDTPHYAPEFETPPQYAEWITEDSKLISTYPAVLKFTGPDLGCPFGHPIRWKGFRLTLREWMRGHFLVQYTVSTFQPQTESSGELVIDLA
jgi:hypothetical protein